MANSVTAYITGKEGYFLYNFAYSADISGLTVKLYYGTSSPPTTLLSSTSVAVGSKNPYWSTSKSKSVSSGTYYLRAYLVDSNNITKASSSTVSAYVSEEADPIPDIPSGRTVSSQTDTGGSVLCKLDWDSETYADYYRVQVQYYTGGSWLDWYTPTNYKDTSSSYYNTSLYYNSTYRFRVASYNANDETNGYSSYYEFTTISPSLQWSFNLNSSGESFNLGAQQWNDFADFINTIRVGKGYSSYSFTQAVSGNKFTAVMANQARTAISAMSPPVSVPSSVSQYGKVTRQWFTDIENALNSLI